jgi:hypothetical protein
MTILCERCLSEAVSSYISDAIPSLDDIRSNKPTEEFPSSAQLASVHCHLTGMLKSIKEQIARLEEARKMIILQIDSVKWINAPVRRLPTDILHQIFLAYCEQPCSRAMKRPKPNSRNRDSSSTVASGFDSKATVEILLTWVCSRWRHIALEMPSLWATVLAHPPAAASGIGRGIYDVSMSEPTIREIYLKTLISNAFNHLSFI